MLGFLMKTTYLRLITEATALSSQSSCKCFYNNSYSVYRAFVDDLK